LKQPHTLYVYIAAEFLTFFRGNSGMCCGTLFPSPFSIQGDPGVILVVSEPHLPSGRWWSRSCRAGLRYYLTGGRFYCAEGSSPLLRWYSLGYFPSSNPTMVIFAMAAFEPIFLQR
jgi:hypothetical protein